MRVYSAGLVVTWVANLVVWGAVGQVALGQEVQGDLAKMQGTWRGTSPEGAALVMVIKDNASKSTITGRGGSFVVEQNLKLDESVDPKTLDFLPPGEQDASKTIPAIYKLEGEKLTICMNPFGGQRPAKFAAGKEGGSLVVYSRGAAKEIGTPKGKPGLKQSSAALVPLQGKWEGWIGQDYKHEDITVEVEGNVLTLSQGKGDALKVVGKSEFKLDDTPNPKQVNSKGIDFTALEGKDSGALEGLAIYQVSQDLKSWQLVLRADGVKRPEKLRVDQDQQKVEQKILLMRPASATASAGPTEEPMPEKPRLPPRRPGSSPSKRPTPSRSK
jgi:uncharacterized protein (TIGR03067 family)